MILSDTLGGQVVKQQSESKLRNVHEKGRLETRFLRNMSSFLIPASRPLTVGKQQVSRLQ